MEAIFPGQILREMREARGLTQNQLDDAAKLKRGSVRDYEQGVRQPQWGRVIALCSALGVTCMAFANPVTNTDVAETADMPKRGRPKKAE